MTPLACGGEASKAPPRSTGTGGGSGNRPGSGGDEASKPPGLGGTSTENVVITEGQPAEVNPCLGENPPDDCQLVALGPACGDGELNQEGEEQEECDDGNTLPGDGCTGICRVEPNFRCPTPGTPCEFDFECGNGEVEPGEVCDDRNQVPDDGCNADCTEQSPDFACPKPGEPCVRVVICGDGRVAGSETCEHRLNDDGTTSPVEGCDEDCHVLPGYVCRRPSECTPQPRCGEGSVDLSLGEVCDAGDGNNGPGQGCAADCTFIESGWACATPGTPCADLTVCGDGVVTGAETCDDADDTDPADGCHACSLTEGFECPFFAAPCLAKCGDGVFLPNMEICDDGNLTDGDGCSAICEWEDGWACAGDPPNYTCSRTVCGDGTRAGTESCDDGNTNLGDGCTPLCEVEPVCNGDACTSACGDGLLLGSEACDDGNNRSDDGCSSDCAVEPGNVCTQPELGESLEVPVVYRDFNADHPDFEPGAEGCEEPTLDMVAPELDAEGKPVLVKEHGEMCSLSTTAQSFADWYREAPDVNDTIVSTLTLWDDGLGNYVNRWGDDGERWTTEIPESPDFCGNISDGATCDDCEFEWEFECSNPCEPWYSDSQICAIPLDPGGVKYYEGNPAFFPLDGLGRSPNGEYGPAVIPEPVYSGNWEEISGEHNFHFTSEVRFWFEYDPELAQVLTFTGDDDVWVFINNQLVVDLGGIHIPVSGTVSIDELAPSLGLSPSQVYEIVVFQAERQTKGSSYQLTLSGFNVAPSECGPICGNGIVSPGEQCDHCVELEGEVVCNPGGYGECNPDCTRGEYCGDGVPNGEEECDDGTNLSAYASTGCGPGCKAPARCGDGEVQGAFGEECDDGVNDGAYGGCNSDCTRAPFCGDGAVAETEQCDDGLNNGVYNTCAAGCVLGPRCGDGEVQADWGEICDDGNHEPLDGCSPTCGEEGICGDGYADRDAGEECDDGVNDGGYGECAPNCVVGPRCGDAVVQGDSEQCDDGVNDGGYGECDNGCVLGPHCGDGRTQDGWEECDDGGQCTGGADEGAVCPEATACPGGACEQGLCAGGEREGSRCSDCPEGACVPQSKDGCSAACLEEISVPR